MTEKGGDLIFTDLIKKHFKEYSEHLDKLGLLDNGDDDKSEGEGEAEERCAVPVKAACIFAPAPK
jgi:hypothetical protein